MASIMTEQSRLFRPSIDQILVTPGGNVQIYHALACTVNPNEEVIVIDLAFVSYNSIMKLLGINPVKVKLKEENEFRFSSTRCKENSIKKTKMIIINSP